MNGKPKKPAEIAKAHLDLALRAVLILQGVETSDFSSCHAEVRDIARKF